MYNKYVNVISLLTAIATLVALAQTICLGQGKSQPPRRSNIQRTYTSIRQVDFKNFDYGQGENLVRIRRGGGRFDGDRVEGVDIHYGDITGDGQEDAVAVINARGEGLTGLYPVGTYIYTLSNGRPERLPDVDLGEMAGLVTAARIQHGLLFVNHLINPQPNGRASPFFSRTWAFRWNGGGFDKVDVLPPATSGETRYYFRLTNCDDGCVAEAGDFVSIKLGEDSGWVDFTDALYASRNVIRFKVNNEGGGIAYGIRVRKNETTVFEKICGRAGMIGCENNRIFPKGVAREFTYTIVK